MREPLLPQKETATKSAAGLYQEGSGDCGGKENLLLSYTWPSWVLVAPSRAARGFPSQTLNPSIVQTPKL